MSRACLVRTIKPCHATFVVQGCQLEAEAAAALSPPAYFLRRWHMLDAFVYFRCAACWCLPHGTPVLRRPIPRMRD